MSNDLGADLDQLLPNGGQRPMLHLVRQPQGSPGMATRARGRCSPRLLAVRRSQLAD
jgi:hypothetical protein